MTQFSLNADQQNILEHADRFARERLYPLAEKMDAEEWWPGEIFPELGRLGMLGTTVDPKYGGAGLDLLSSGLICQAIARWNHALALSWVAHDNLCANNLANNGSEHLCEKYLPGLCDGSLVGALALTEPGAGSDALGSMRTSARKAGDQYVLNGGKLYITNGPVADVVLLYAKTNPEAGNRGISAFLVESSFPGFKVAQKLAKMGFRGSPTAELVLEDCVVPAENLIGEENLGVKVVMSGLDLERAMIAPIALGIAERALELSIEWAKTREQFGQPIANFQMIRGKLADMYVWVVSIRSLTYEVLARCSEISPDEAGRGAIHMHSASAVMYAANTCNQVLNEMVQIHGGSGYIFESEANRLYRANKLLEIGAGTTEVRKMIISDGLLK